MKEMKTHKNAVSLLTIAVSAVITMVVGIGFGILLNGFVQGFLVLPGIALVLALIIAWRRPFSLELHLQGPVPEIELVRRHRAGKGRRREPVQG